jgi:hypothetical protein
MLGCVVRDETKPVRPCYDATLGVLGERGLALHATVERWAGVCRSGFSEMARGGVRGRW